MYYLYIVECVDKTLYTGITTDLKRRVLEHNEDDKLGAKYTHSRRPVKLVFFKKFKSRSIASREELATKKLKRSKKLELIKKI